MLWLRGLIASCLAASALASPHLISADISGPRLEVARNVKRAGVPRDTHFSREPGAPMIRRDGLAARTNTETISFDQTLEDQVLFNSSLIPFYAGPSLAVVCAKCCSKGAVEATFPSDLEDIVNPKFRVDLAGVEVYVEVDVIVSDSNQFVVPLLPFLPGLTNINLPGLRAGLFIDLLLVLGVSGAADVRGGFYVKIPDGAFFEIDISEDGDTTQEFPEVVAKTLPVTINNEVTGIQFKAALQLKAELGITTTTDDDSDISIPGLGGVDIPLIDLPDIGAGAVVGAFVNLVEYIADVTPDDGDCALEASQELNFNMGVFAKVGVSLEKEFVGLKPEATTTLFTLPLPSACLLESGLPIPVRETPLPVAGECAAEATGSGVAGESRPTETSCADDDDEEDEEQTTTVTKKSTLVETTTVPHSANVSPGGVYLDDTEQDDTTTLTKKSTTLKTTTTPSPTTTLPSAVYVIPRAEPAVGEITAVACVSNMADCPEDLKTTLTYTSTACAPAPTKTGACFAVSDASALEATSVVRSNAAAAAAAATATATGTAGKVRRRYR